MADRIKKHMGARVRILPPGVEKNVKDFAQNVESLVDKVVSGERSQEGGRGTQGWVGAWGEGREWAWRAWWTRWCRVRGGGRGYKRARLRWVQGAPRAGTAGKLACEWLHKRRSCSHSAVRLPRALMRPPPSPPPRSPRPAGEMGLELVENMDKFVSGESTPPPPAPVRAATLSCLLRPRPRPLQHAHAPLRSRPPPGFISNFERSYSKFEKVLKSTIR